MDARDLPVTPKGQAGAGAELSQQTVNAIVRKTMMLHRKIKRKQQQQQRQQQPQRRFNTDNNDGSDSGGTGSGATKYDWSLHNVININANTIESVINEFDNHNHDHHPHQSDSDGVGDSANNARDNSTPNPRSDPGPDPDPSLSPGPVCTITVLSDPLPLLLLSSSHHTTTDSVGTSADIRSMIYGPRYTSPSPDANSPGASADSPVTGAFSSGVGMDSPGSNYAFSLGTNVTNALCCSLPYQHMRSKLLAPSEITPLPVKSSSQNTPRPIKSSQIDSRPVKPPSQNIDPIVDPHWCDRWYTPGSLLWTPGK